MPVRATARGSARTPVDLDADVLICGASFAGLAVARELARASSSHPARTGDQRVIVVDRYEIGERQTSACAAPKPWIDALGLGEAILQTFERIVVRTPDRRFSWPLPEPFCTFDYPVLCRLLAAQGDFTFLTATVRGRDAERPDGRIPVQTDRGEIRAPLVVDALGWRRILAPEGAAPIQPPEAYLSRGLEVHPPATSGDLELFLDPRYVPDGYSWSFPAGDEVRIGVGSFDPHDHVKGPTLRLAADLGREPVGFQGNWIPHRLRPATDDGVFFVGDSAGHCFPLTAEGIRPAWYFGTVLGRELRWVHEGRQTRRQALSRYAAASAAKSPAYFWLLRLQRIVGRTVPRRRTLRTVLGLVAPDPVGRRAWGRYLRTLPAPAAAPAAAETRPVAAQPVAGRA